MSISTIRSLSAFEQNETRLQSEHHKIIQTLQETIQAETTAKTGLLDRISLLQAEVEDERRHAAAAEKALQAERGLTAALERQAQQLQARVTKLEKRDRILTEMVAALEALEGSDTSKLFPNGIVCSLDYMDWPTFNMYSKFKSDYQQYSHVPVPQHLRSIVDLLQTAKQT